MDKLYFIILIAVFFYCLIPGVGAFYTRSRWRKFRSSLIQASLSEELRFRHLHTEADSCLGDFRFLGSLQAIQGDSEIWVGNEDLSVRAEVAQVTVHILPSITEMHNSRFVDHSETVLPDDMPRQVPWSRISSIPEGTGVLLFGPFFSEQGRGVFRSTKQRRLTMVIYDGDQKSIIRRSIWAGRQKNEYWNLFSLPSVAAGSFSLFLRAYVLLRTSYYQFESYMALTLCLLPLLPFLPPGLLFFYLYNFLWKRGRILRGERDLYQLPNRYFSEEMYEHDQGETSLPNGEAYCFYRVKSLNEALSKSKEGRLRSSRLIPLKNREDRSYYVFGKPQSDGKLGQPSDPMAEVLIVPDKPYRLSKMCVYRARIMELLAAVSIILCFLTNGILTFYLITLFVRLR